MAEKKKKDLKKENKVVAEEEDFDLEAELIKLGVELPYMNNTNEVRKPHKKVEDEVIELAENLNKIGEMRLEMEKEIELNKGTLSKVQKYNGGKVVAKYPYVNKDGAISYEIWRMEGGKEPFYTMHPGKDGQDLSGLGRNKTIPYNLPKVLETRENNGVIFVVEGESKADTLNELGYTATTVPYKGTDKWNDRYNKYVKYGNILIVADNDDNGREFSENTYSVISDVAKNIGILELNSIYPQLKEGGDIEDLRKIVNNDNNLKKVLDNIINDFMNDKEVR